MSGERIHTPGQGSTALRSEGGAAGMELIEGRDT